MDKSIFASQGSQLTNVQFMKSEAATTERSKIVSCFTHRYIRKKNLKGY